MNHKQKLYLRWFSFSITQFIITLSLYLYMRITGKHFLTIQDIIYVFMWMVMSLGWSATALVGMVDHKHSKD